MKQLNAIQLLLLLLFVMLFSFTTLAQDPTPTAEGVVVGDSDVVVGDTEIAPEEVVNVEASVLTYILMAASALIGVLVGGGGVLAVLSRARNDEALLTALEGLAKSVPPDVAKRILEIIENISVGLEVAEEVLDDIPFADKPRIN